MTDRKVTYTYDLSGRLKTMDYPSAQTLTYSYDALGRRTVVNDGTNDLVTDTWKGQLLEKREYHSGAYLTHLNDSGANLSGYGYDTFGRIKNHRWKDSGGTLLAGWSHDYDRVGNKLYQEDLEDATESELYDYDGVYRLTSFERGQLNANKDDIASPTRSQTWTLDPLGNRSRRGGGRRGRSPAALSEARVRTHAKHNWDDTTIDSSTETRTHNSVNELTARTPSGSSLAVLPACPALVLPIVGVRIVCRGWFSFHRSVRCRSRSRTRRPLRRRRWSGLPSRRRATGAS